LTPLQNRDLIAGWLWAGCGDIKTRTFEIHKHQAKNRIDKNFKDLGKLKRPSSNNLSNVSMLHLIDGDGGNRTHVFIVPVWTK
jgi:hypothetical protein